jgi:hypothetical protein
VKLGAKGLDIRWEGLRRRTEGGPVAADLIISVDGAAVKYNVYLRENDILLVFGSTDRSRVELAARLLKLAGVNVKMKKDVKRGAWYVYAYTDMLAGGGGGRRTQKSPRQYSQGGRQEREEGGAVAEEAGERAHGMGGLAEVPRGACAKRRA